MCKETKFVQDRVFSVLFNAYFDTNRKKKHVPKHVLAILMTDMEADFRLRSNRLTLPINM